LALAYTLDARQTRDMFFSACAHLTNNKQILNDLNVFPVPDGDTGSNMSMTVAAAAKEVLAKAPENLDALARTVSGASLRGARGNSGVILSQLFRGMAKVLKEYELCDAKALAESFEEGVKAAYRAVMKPTEGTMLTVARDAAKAASEACAETANLAEFLAVVTEAAQKSLDNTPNLLPQLKEAGVVDSGGQGVAFLLEGARRYAVTGEAVQSVSVSAEEKAEPAAAMLSGEIKFGYCTEFLIEKSAPKASSALFRKAVERAGDSMVVIDDEGIIKVHIHTNRPGFVITEALKLGELTRVKIDNMRYQHEQLSRESAENPPKPQADAPEAPEKTPEASGKREIGFVAVGSGDGICKLLREMGADEIVSGGQTMNPSADDLLAAAGRVNAETVFLLPNNKNVVLAAQQAKELAPPGKKLAVLPTKSVLAGFSALLAFERTKTAAENEAAALRALEGVVCGQVTRAVRDTSVDGRAIAKNDALGMIESRIAVVGKDCFDALQKLLAEMADGDSEIITVLCGEAVDDEMMEKTGAWLEETYGDLDILLRRGGQPLYPYFVSVE
jgi:DAK2 domain fusion protein YloV